MDFKELEAFMTVVTKKSISAAAPALGLSQPAVSKRLSRLEEELDVTLFVPGHRHGALTEAGKALYRGTIKLLELREKMIQEVATRRDELSGRVTIAASSVPGDYMLPAVVAQFCKENPSVAVAVDVSDSQNALALLAEKKADLALIGQEKNLPGYRVENVFEDEIVVAVPKGHPLSTRRDVRFQDLVGYLQVSREQGSGTRSVFERLCPSECSSLKDATLSFTSLAGQLNAVANGVGYGIVSRAAAVSLGDKIKLVSLYPKVTRHFTLVRSACESMAVERFAEFLAAKGKSR